MNRLKTPQEKANERYQAESIKPMYAFIIVCVAFIITAILQNIQYESRITPNDSFRLLQNKNNKEIQLFNIRHNNTPPHFDIVLFYHFKQRNMKTAMQELFDEMTSINWHLYSFEDKIKIINVHFEKEKEQIKDAWDAGMCEGIGTTMANLEWDGEFINYYNETYNQNK